MRPLALLLLLTGPLVAQDSDFIPLFNGKDLDGWEAVGGKNAAEAWSVKDGIVVAKPGGGWLATKKEYGDFILRLERRICAGGNSGVFLRVPTTKFNGSPSGSGMEIQILDDFSPRYKDKLNPYQYAGSIYGVRGPKKSVFKGPDEWNAFEITCQKDLVNVRFNGVDVAEADMSMEPKLKGRPRRGLLGLQNHGSGRVSQCVDQDARLRRTRSFLTRYNHLHAASLSPLDRRATRTDPFGLAHRSRRARTAVSTQAVLVSLRLRLALLSDVLFRHVDARLGSGTDRRRPRADRQDESRFPSGHGLHPPAFASSAAVVTPLLRSLAIRDRLPSSCLRAIGSDSRR